MSTTKPKRTGRRAIGYGETRELLLRRREELLAQMNDVLADSRLDRVGAQFQDAVDRATDSLYQELAQGVAEIATANLHKIDRALEKIERKTYGTCEVCGKQIPQARLRALPFADLCVRCQQEVEEEAASDAYGHLGPHRRN